MRQRDLWYDRLVHLRSSSDITLQGHKAYCEEKISHWEEFARVAAFHFRTANPDYPDVWRPTPFFFWW